MQTVNPFDAPTKIPHEIKQVKEEPPPPTETAGVLGGTGSGGSLGGVLGGIGNAPAPVVKAATPKKIAISSGVMTGLKIGRSEPDLSSDRACGPHLGYGGAAGDDFQARERSRTCALSAGLRC